MALVTLVDNAAGTAANATYAAHPHECLGEYGSPRGVTLYAWASVWGSASVKIQVSPDGENWFDTQTTFTTNGYATLAISAMVVRAVVSAATSTTAGLNVLVR